MGYGDFVGETIDKYLLIELLGKGGYGAVFRAEDRTVPGREVALKIIPKSLESSRNKRIIAGLPKAFKSTKMDSRLATLYEFNERDRFYYQISELVEGESLETWIKKRPSFNHVGKRVAGIEITKEFFEKSVLESANIMLEILKGIRSLHENGYVHRDMTSSNIIITKDKSIKIIDFDLVKESRDFLRTLTAKEGRILVGKHIYTAPEIIMGKTNLTLEEEISAELYQSGIMFYELLTGEHPILHSLIAKYQWRDPDKFKDLESIIRYTSDERLEVEISNIIEMSAFPRPSKLNPYLKDLSTLEMTNLKLLDINPQMRYHNANEAINDLSSYLENKRVKIKISRDMEARMDREKTLKKRRLRKAILIPLVSLCVAVGGGILVQEYTAPPPSFEQIYLEKDKVIKNSDRLIQTYKQDYPNDTGFILSLHNFEHSLYDRLKTWLSFEEKIEPIQYPWVTTNVSAYKGHGKQWTDGIFAGMVWKGYEQAPSQESRSDWMRWATRWKNGIIRDKQVTVELTRFYFAYHPAFDMLHDENAFELISDINDDLIRTLYKSPGVLIERTYDDIRNEIDDKRITSANFWNLTEPLWWEYKKTDNPIRKEELYSILQNHYRTLSQKLFESDGEEKGLIRQIYDFNKGYIKSQHGQEGRFARGQMLAVLGLLSGYENAMNQDKPWYLDRAEQATAYYISHLPSSKIPFMDMKEGIMDPGAAAVAFWAFGRLFQATGHNEYLNLAKATLISLMENNYIVDKKDGIDFQPYFIKKIPLSNHQTLRSCTYVLADYALLQGISYITQLEKNGN